jgi:hypothetical protein
VKFERDGARILCKKHNIRTEKCDCEHRAVLAGKNVLSVTTTSATNTDSTHMNVFVSHTHLHFSHSDQIKYLIEIALNGKFKIEIKEKII